MRTKDFLMLEAAYQAVVEAKQTPCPCTIGKKCKDPECKCKRCKKDKKKMMQEMHEDGMSSEYDDTDEQGPSETESLLGRIKAILMAHREDPEANTPETVIADIKEILSGGGHQEDRHYTSLDAQLP